MAGKKTGATLGSIAAELGVSKTTVSNAYNHPDRLSKPLRDLIFATAADHGYPGPHPTARSLKTRRTGAVGVLLTEHLTYAFEDLASVSFLAGMAEALAGPKTPMLLLPVGPDPSVEKAAAARLVNSCAVDGFVVYSVAADDPYLAAVRSHDTPVVICDQPADDPQAAFVGIDDRLAIAPAARALLEAGHTSIGILTIRLDRQKNDGPVSPQRLAGAGHHVQRSRVTGALEVFARAGIDPGTVPVIERHINDAANCRDAAAEMLHNHPRITAVLCTTDSMALGVIDYAQAHGIRVPEDLSVTGFDGIITALHRDVTTVIQPTKDKGRATGEVLMTLLSPPPGGAVKAEKTILPTVFRPGSTVAAPRPGRLR
ncbi:LacI family DNA-binding transcriptional regulator [Corynebacterium mendelii]|uniref:LacI family DNA-binding transcriptional regulator n=1 Tax=Corynebacterium mendelii TaxID=2765362 RepID=A0A939E224_9CORY|nr:LacI family DNA-binding transcriptional regulator [Corynebacterium mendelii]MBN9645071.1 LacI family DNA-binding transcriptional regulator [Corynebacterium mendelii]